MNENFFIGDTTGWNDAAESNYTQWQIDPNAEIVNGVQTYPWSWTYSTISAREQVQNEILTKVAAAIEGDDLKKAKELLALAKQLKEL